MGRKKEKEELPDYTVANMDLEGMPWNRKRPWSLEGMSSRSLKNDNRRPEEEKEKTDQEPDEPYTKEESRWMILAALKAALLIGLVFALAAFLFVLFCLFVWLR